MSSRGSRETADAVTARWGGTSFDAVDRMLDEAAPEVVYVAVPPHRSVAVLERLVERGIPFLVEKPLAAPMATVRRGWPTRSTGPA